MQTLANYCIYKVIYRKRVLKSKHIEVIFATLLTIMNANLSFLFHKALKNGALNLLFFTHPTPEPPGLKVTSRGSFPHRVRVLHSQPLPYWIMSPKVLVQLTSKLSVLLSWALAERNHIGSWVTLPIKTRCSSIELPCSVLCPLK